MWVPELVSTGWESLRRLGGGTKIEKVDRPIPVKSWPKRPAKGQNVPKLPIARPRKGGRCRGRKVGGGQPWGKKKKRKKEKEGLPPFPAEKEAQEKEIERVT